MREETEILVVSERERERHSAIIEEQNGKLIKWDCESYLIRSFHPPTNF